MTRSRPFLTVTNAVNTMGVTIEKIDRYADRGNLCERCTLANSGAFGAAGANAARCYTTGSYAAR